MRRNTLKAAPLLAAALLGGCTSLAPKYERPAPPIPSAWPQGPAYPAPSAGTSDVADLAWRAMFVDPKLQTVIERALQNNRDLRVAILNVQAARAEHQIQRAALFPSLTGSTSLTRQHTPKAAFGLPGGGSLDERLYSLSGRVSEYEVDLFGRVRSLTKAAFEQYLASEEARKAAQITIIAETATDYLTLAADRDRLVVAKQTLESQQASLTLAQGRFKAGEASELDVRQAETTVDQARAQVAAYTTQTAQDVNALELVVGARLPDELLPPTLDGPSPLLTDVPAGLSSQVLLRRPDVLEAEHQLKAMNADIGAARAAFFPTLSLTASGGAESPGLSSLFNAGTGAWSFAPSLTAPIFDWGANRGRLSYAKAQRGIAVAQYEKSVQTAFRETADALARRGTIGEELDADEANVMASTASLHLTEARYQQGVDPYLNTLVAQQNLYATRQSWISTKLSYYANLVALYEALGGGANGPTQLSHGAVQPSPGMTEITRSK
jgi:multidrug efflux system outer membrane protein